MDKPRSLADEQERHRRRAMLTQPHIRPLTQYAEKLEASGYGAVPYFDPADGGISARALFLFEKPGPQADASGFISRDNDDPTAEATFRFMEEAGITRAQACLWNVIPGWNGTRKVTAVELRSGVEHLESLFTLLPDLRAVVLVGRKAERARPLLEGGSLAVLSSCHPSPINRASKPERWRSIPSEWARVLDHI